MKKRTVILAALLLFAALYGCGAPEKAQEKAAEKAIENAVGGDVQVDIEGEKYTVDYGDGKKMELGGTEWPADAKAGFIPKFNAGTVCACTIMDNMYLIDVETVAQKDYESYLQAVKDAGFLEQALTTDAEGYYQYQAADSKGNYIVLSFESGEKTLQIMGTAAQE